jgi:hypothetical protein
MSQERLSRASGLSFVLIFFGERALRGRGSSWRQYASWRTGWDFPWNSSLSSSGSISAMGPKRKPWW